MDDPPSLELMLLRVIDGRLQKIQATLDKKHIALLKEGKVLLGKTHQDHRKHVAQLAIIRAKVTRQSKIILKTSEREARLRTRIIVLKAQNMALRQRIKELDAFIEPAYEEK